MADRVDDKQEIGIGGFSALARVRNVITKNVEAPDTPLEDGSMANDHVIKKPIIIEIEGKVADVFIRPAAETTVFRRALAEIGNINKYLPEESATQASKAAAIALDANNALKGIQAAIKDGRQLIDFFGDKTEERSNQELFLLALDSYYENSSVMRIEMPDRIYDNMIITSRPITYDNQNGSAIAFKITAKQLTFSDVIFSDVSEFFANPASGNVGDQTSGQESNGLNDAPETSLAASGVRFIGSFLQ